MVARLGFQRLCPASQPSPLWHLSCVCQPLTHNERRGARRAGETQRDPVCLQPLEAHLEQQSIKLILLPLFVWPRRSCFIICPLLASSSSRLSHDSSCPSLLDVSLTSFDPVSHSVSSFFSLFPSPSLCLSPLPSIVVFSCHIHPGQPFAPDSANGAFLSLSPARLRVLRPLEPLQLY